MEYLAQHIAKQLPKARYLKSVSTTKLVEISERVFSGEFGIFYDRDLIFSEMIHRLKDKASSERLIGKISHILNNEDISQHDAMQGQAGTEEE
jgi:hypothetical protein